MAYTITQQRITDELASLSSEEERRQYSKDVLEMQRSGQIEVAFTDATRVEEPQQAPEEPAYESWITAAPEPAAELSREGDFVKEPVPRAQEALSVAAQNIPYSLAETRREFEKVIRRTG